MSRIFLILSVIALVVGFVWWFNADDDAKKQVTSMESRARELARDKEVSQKEGDHKKEAKEGEEKAEKAEKVEKEGVIAVPFPEESNPTRVDDITIVQHAIDDASYAEKRYSADVREWLKSVRVFSEHIQVMRFVAGGTPQKVLLGEGADPIDLHEEYKKVSKESGSLNIPMSCDESIPLVRGLKRKLSNIMDMLSDPPTLEELEAVESDRVGLVDTINELYGIINSYCD